MDFLEAGIKAESLRQKAIANNIANLETPGYRRIDVKFMELLAKALDSRGNIDLSEIEAQIYHRWMWLIIIAIPAAIYYVLKLMEDI